MMLKFIFNAGWYLQRQPAASHTMEIIWDAAIETVLKVLVVLIGWHTDISCTCVCDAI